MKHLNISFLISFFAFSLTPAFTQAQDRAAALKAALDKQIAQLHVAQTKLAEKHSEIDAKTLGSLKDIFSRLLDKEMEAISKNKDVKDELELKKDETPVDAQLRMLEHVKDMEKTLKEQKPLEDAVFKAVAKTPGGVFLIMNLALSAHEQIRRDLAATILAAKPDTEEKVDELNKKDEVAMELVSEAIDYRIRQGTEKEQVAKDLKDILDIHEASKVVIWKDELTDIHDMLEKTDDPAANEEEFQKMMEQLKNSSKPRSQLNIQDSESSRSGMALSLDRDSWKKMGRGEDNADDHRKFQ